MNADAELYLEKAARRQSRPVFGGTTAELDGAEYLASLHESTYALLARRDPNELLETIVARAAALVESPDGYLYVVDQAADVLRVAVGLGDLRRVGRLRARPRRGAGGPRLGDRRADRHRRLRAMDGPGRAPRGAWDRLGRRRPAHGGPRGRGRHRRGRGDAGTAVRAGGRGGDRPLRPAGVDGARERAPPRGGAGGDRGARAVRGGAPRGHGAAAAPRRCVVRGARHPPGRPDPRGEPGVRRALRPFAGVRRRPAGARPLPRGGARGGRTTPRGGHRAPRGDRRPPRRRDGRAGRGHRPLHRLRRRGRRAGDGDPGHPRTACDRGAPDPPVAVRRAHGPAQPVALPGPGVPRARVGAPGRRAACGGPGPGPRPVQGDQRELRTRGGRPDHRGGRAAVRGRDPPRRHARTPRRRRVRGPRDRQRRRVRGARRRRAAPRDAGHAVPRRGARQLPERERRDRPRRRRARRPRACSARRRSPSTARRRTRTAASPSSRPR